jgi:hypothetical protein
MDINTIIRVVESHGAKLANRWLERLRKEEGMMEAYLRVPEADLLAHIRAAYEEIGLYLDQPRHQVIVEHFRETGRHRRKEGVPLVEVVRAVQLARSTLWQYILEQGVLDSTVNLYQALNLFRQIVAFFDCAAIFAIEGYVEEDGAGAGG